ncbi:hypothetical protein SKAU_G00013450 [Synaphobranchus kaupii]|uniref:Uncharacterized protein n=1 Tax=Synaphobranchus kaupii TaxID=118154 RepID=A0A9Q1GC96_SYNKA|nr:hypothetical protein SKAU_G00013450 [Synaphobranchus kaupii]
MVGSVDGGQGELAVGGVCGVCAERAPYSAQQNACEASGPQSMHVAAPTHAEKGAHVLQATFYAARRPPRSAREQRGRGSNYTALTITPRVSLRRELGSFDSEIPPRSSFHSPG